MNPTDLPKGGDELCATNNAPVAVPKSDSTEEPTIQSAQSASKGQQTSNPDAGLTELVAVLADGYNWSWTRMISERNAADAFLSLLARYGFIETIDHPLGGHVWRVGDKLYGRTDQMPLKRFKRLHAQQEDEQ